MSESKRRPIRKPIWLQDYLQSIETDEDPASKTTIASSSKAKMVTKVEYSDEDLNNAIAAVKNNGMSVNSAAKKFGIPRRTLTRRISSGCTTTSCRSGPKPVLDSYEAALVRWIIRMNDDGYIVTKQGLSRAVVQISRVLSPQSPLNSGSKWIKLFLARNRQIAQRVKFRARSCIAPWQVQQFLRSVQALLNSELGDENRSVVTNWLSKRDEDLNVRKKRVSNKNVLESSTPPEGAASPRKTSHSQQFRCDACGRLFGSKQGLREHYAVVHEHRFLYECDICGKRLSHAAQYSIHSKVCAARRNAVNAAAAANSEEAHISDADCPYKCSQCEMRFVHKVGLQSHVKRHSAPTFKCAHCPKQFKWASDRNRHQRTVHAFKSFYCQLCLRKFVDRSDCKRHALLSHGVDDSSSMSDCVGINTKAIIEYQPSVVLERISESTLKSYVRMNGEVLEHSKEEHQQLNADSASNSVVRTPPSCSLSPDKSSLQQEPELLQDIPVASSSSSFPQQTAKLKVTVIHDSQNVGFQRPASLSSSLPVGGDADGSRDLKRSSASPKAFNGISPKRLVLTDAHISTMTNKPSVIKVEETETPKEKTAPKIITLVALKVGGRLVFHPVAEPGYADQFKGVTIFKGTNGNSDGNLQTNVESESVIISPSKCLVSNVSKEQPSCTSRDGSLLEQRTSEIPNGDTSVSRDFAEINGNFDSAKIKCESQSLNHQSLSNNFTSAEDNRLEDGYCRRGFQGQELPNSDVELSDIDDDVSTKENTEIDKSASQSTDNLLNCSENSECVMQTGNTNISSTRVVVVSPKEVVVCDNAILNSNDSPTPAVEDVVKETLIGIKHEVISNEDIDADDVDVDVNGDVDNDGNGDVDVDVNGDVDDDVNGDVNDDVNGDVDDDDDESVSSTMADKDESSEEEESDGRIPEENFDSSDGDQGQTNHLFFVQPDFSDSEYYTWLQGISNPDLVSDSDMVVGRLDFLLKVQSDIYGALRACAQETDPAVRDPGVVANFSKLIKASAIDIQDAIVRYFRHMGATVHRDRLARVRMNSFSSQSTSGS